MWVLLAWPRVAPAIVAVKGDALPKKQVLGIVWFQNIKRILNYVVVEPLTKIENVHFSQLIISYCQEARSSSQGDLRAKDVNNSCRTVFVRNERVVNHSAHCQEKNHISFFSRKCSELYSS